MDNSASSYLVFRNVAQTGQVTFPALARFHPNVRASANG